MGALRKTAFSLIELLVVVAIIGILAALSLPALSKAKKSANNAVCANNLRQFGYAAQMYWNDSDGRPFAYKSGATNGGDIYWFGWLERGAEGERRFDASMGPLYSYVREGVRLCPQLNYALADFKLKAKGAAYGYGYNLHLSPSPALGALRMSELKRPEALAVFADAAQVNTFQAPASPENPMLEEFYYISNTEPTTHFRHGRRAWVSFADGHAGAELPAANSIDERLPQHLVGRLASASLLP